jgi:CHASE2 domain-containing sensor protein
VVAAVAVTLAFSLVLEREGAPSRAALALQAQTSPRVAARVKVVRIDDVDYHRLFRARSPMDPSKLKEVIRAIAAGGPSVIGVDVESVDTAYASLPDFIMDVPIVWARVFRCVRNGTEVSVCPAAERLEQPEAGNREIGQYRAGFVMLPVEPDGSVQRYSRVVEARSGSRLSFTTAILQRAGVRVMAEAPTAFHLIQYRRTSAADSVFTAQWVLNAAAAGGVARNGVFRGRIVLLGGSFWQGRDHYTTPVGDLAGVEVLAQILETELDGGGPREPKAWQLFIIQCLAGFGIVAIFHRRHLPVAFGMSLALCALAAPAASLFAFRTWKLWFYFLPALCAWLIQQLYDEAQAYRNGLIFGPKPEAGSVSGNVDAGQPRVMKPILVNGDPTSTPVFSQQIPQSPQLKKKRKNRRRRG